MYNLKVVRHVKRKRESRIWRLFSEYEEEEAECLMTLNQTVYLKLMVWKRIRVSEGGLRSGLAEKSWEVESRQSASRSDFDVLVLTNVQEGRRTLRISSAN